jgi:hypothetical protein
MRKLLVLVIAAALVYGYLQERGVPLPDVASWSQRAGGTLREAYEHRESGVQVQGEGVVTRILDDDRVGSRHQRFILRLEDGQTVLVAHNIDLAPRIDGLAVGNTVAFYGEYAWNAKGGVIHWTHHDPGGTHADGWLKHDGRIYQ